MGVCLNVFARCYQAVLWVTVHFIRFKEPEVISGKNVLSKVPEILTKNDKHAVLVVTDQQLFALGLLKPLFDALDKAKFKYAVYHDVVANPTVDNVEAGLKILKENHCDSIIAVGGGSAMDAAKTIAARAVKNKPVNKMRGILKVRKKPLFLIATPTTAGTGSETTVCAVIVDKSKGDKYAINDPVLIPRIALLDPTLLVGLPKHISSSTGMDALTHAVEAYIGHANTHKTKIYGVEATKLVFEYLEKSVNEPTNFEYRRQMQIAAFKAGVAFTKAYVGDVHALAHAIGGKYNVPHGLANAIILPKVLKAFGKSAEKKLAKLADAVGIKGHDNHEKATLFIKEIEDMNARMGIVNTFGNLIKNEDLDYLVNHAYKEAVPLYPTPRILSRDELKAIYQELQSGR